MGAKPHRLSVTTEDRAISAGKDMSDRGKSEPEATECAARLARREPGAAVLKAETRGAATPRALVRRSLAGVMTVVAASAHFSLLRVGFQEAAFRPSAERKAIRAALRVLVTTLAIVMTAPVDARTFDGQVIRILDGDTVEILVNRRPVRVRLAAIDAPEIRHGREDPGQPFGDKSRRSLTTMIGRQTVSVDEKGTDRYGRTIGTLYKGGIDINAEQVRLGMAWVYRAYSSDPRLIGLEEEARGARRGLWADPHPDLVPSWLYRHYLRDPWSRQLDQEARKALRCP